jgi:DNA processing protein
VLERCDALYITPLTMQDAAYPERLRSLHVPPLVLYVKGKLPVIDEEAALGVVGTRSATPYGLDVTRRLCFQLAKAGMLIVSGMAAGVDAAAHRAALDAGASTVAVLGGGADVIYPYENAELYRDVCASGAVVSEYPPGTRAEGRHFPVRNRIISGLSRGVLVIEGSRRSGSLITANHALEQGRDIFAVPGAIDSPNSEAPNNLIREGATLVSHASHILDEYLPLFPSKILPVGRNDLGAPFQKQTAPPKTRRAAPAPPPTPPRPPVDLTAAVAGYTPVQQKLLLCCAGVPKHIDAIVAECGGDAAGVSTELTLLEIDGLLQQLPGKRFVWNIKNPS